MLAPHCQEENNPHDLRAPQRHKVIVQGSLAAKTFMPCDTPVCERPV